MSELQPLVLRRSGTADDAARMEGRIAELESQISALSAETEQSAEAVTVESAGYFSEQTDGLERVLTPESVLQMKPSELRAAAQHASAVPGNAVGRLITGQKWYFAAEIPEARAEQTAAGETLTAGQTVTLTVCAGAGVELVKVPALLGETVDEAIADIKDAGLEPGQVRYVESDLPKDTVTYQSVDAGEQVKAGTVINLQASKGPEQARTPFVRSVSQDAEVGLNEELTLRVEAETSDNGTLSYAWYVSENGSVDGASLVSRSAEDNDSCIVDTSRTGTFYYFCKITNTLGDATESVNSPMIEVVVGPSNDTVDKVIYVTMPSDGRTHTVTVYVAGVQQMEPFEVEAGGVQIPIQVSGSGEQNVDIYLDGSLYDSQLVDFTTVG